MALYVPLLVVYWVEWMQWITVCSIRRWLHACMWLQHFGGWGLVTHTVDACSMHSPSGCPAPHWGGERLWHQCRVDIGDRDCRIQRVSALKGYWASRDNGFRCVWIWAFAESGRGVGGGEGVPTHMPIETTAIHCKKTFSYFNHTMVTSVAAGLHVNSTRLYYFNHIVATFLHCR